MLPITAKQRALGAYGVEYFGFSEGSRSTRRTILVVLPFRPASDTLCPGQEVIVHSRRSSAVEVALAEVTTATNGLTLRFSDSNPASNEPLIYPIKRDGHVVTAKAKNISIEAIVIGKWESAKS
jgi:hypothetical protein